MLTPASGSGVFAHGRSAPEGPLAELVAHIWWVEWAVPMERRPFTQRVLTDPCVHVTVEHAAEPARMHGHATPTFLLHGVVRDVFSVDLPARGWVCGACLHPGAFTALTGRSGADDVGTVVPATERLTGLDAVDSAVLAEPDRDGRARAYRAALGQAWGQHVERVQDDASYQVVRRACDLLDRREATTVAGVAESVNVSARTLQRLFGRYIGLTPQWVVRRHRMQDAAARIDADEGQSLADIAADVGWSDQAHFTRDFAAVLGVTPAVYRDRARRRGGSGAASGA